MSEEKKLVIVGTAHVSRKSVEEVIRTIEEEKPDAVAVELDLRRYKALKGEREEIDLTYVIRKGNVFLLLFQLILSHFQRRIGKETGVMPGEEMLAAIEKAKEIGADVLLIDRDLGITFNRLWTSLGFFEKLKLFFHVIRGLFESGDIEVDDLLEKDVLDMLTEEFRKISPKTAEILIDERDAYMAHNLLRAMQKYNKIVAVVGAGHKKGIEKFLSNSQELPDMASLLEIRRKKFSMAKILGFGVAIFVLATMLAILMKLGTSEFFSALAVWFLANGILSAVFAGIAGAHPFSVLVAFFTAWLTSLSPFLAAGWFSGITEFIVRKPTHRDLEEILCADSLKALYENKAFKVLLVAAMTNIGSTIGTICGVWYLSTHYGVDIKEIIYNLIRL